MKWARVLSSPPLHLSLCVIKPSSDATSCLKPASVLPVMAHCYYVGCIHSIVNLMTGILIHLGNGSNIQSRTWHRVCIQSINVNRDVYQELNNLRYILEHIQEKGMAVHSSILACEIPWTEEPAGLQSFGLQTVWYNWATNIFTFIC